MSYEKLIETIEQVNPTVDLGFIEDVYRFSEEAHKGQFRHSGEPYVSHPIAVATILAELGLDESTIAAGLLHDVAEDTECSLECLSKHFGDEVSFLVGGVTKLSKLEYNCKEERQLENYRKMFLAMAKDVRVMLIKLADRLHNMRTLKHQGFWKQREVATETLEIFAPLAHRLGISKLKWELEDLSLRYLEPDQYYDLVSRISMKRKEREEYSNQVIDILKKEFDEAELLVDISGRPKHFYSIYNKMVKKNKELSEIYDLIAVRILVDSVKDCYAVLGIIHTLWKPIPGRFKDYIAMPKPNMYQSLHTTVIGPNGDPFEIQIRTWEMHKTAEYGIAAHWLYKEGSTTDATTQFAWLHQLEELQDEVENSKEFLETVKYDLFSDSVFVFSPKGDVYELPAGSIPIDFAYRVHTAIGHRCIGSKVNGKIVPLEYKLKTGDIVEILTSKQANGPSKDWLNIAKSTQAKNRIRQWFKKEKRDEHLLQGRELLEKEVKKHQLDQGFYTKLERLNTIARRFGFSNGEDLLVAIGEGAVSAASAVLKLREEYRREHKEPTAVVTTVALLASKENKTAKKQNKSSKNSQGVRVKGNDDVVVRFSRCCTPLPGDSIIGYITRGRGVSIHRQDCPNVKQYRLDDEGRLVEAAWEEGEKNSFQVQVMVVALDRPRVTAEVMGLINDSKVHISAITAKVNRQSQTVMDLTLDVESLEQLHSIMDKVKKIKDIIDVQRVTPKAE